MNIHETIIFLHTYMSTHKYTDTCTNIYTDMLTRLPILI